MAGSPTIIRQVDEACPTTIPASRRSSGQSLSPSVTSNTTRTRGNFRSCIFRLSTVYAPRSEGNTPNFVGHYANAINMGEPMRLPAAACRVATLCMSTIFSRACQAFADSVIRHGLYNLGGGTRTR